MPRKSRIDAPGTLHHIIAMGIERKRIFGHQYCGHSVLMAKRKAVRELGITMSFLARNLKISVPAVSKSAIRGEKLAKARKDSLVG